MGYNVQKIQLNRNNSFDTINILKGGNIPPENTMVVYQGSSNLEGTELLSIVGNNLSSTQPANILSNGGFQNWTDDDPDNWGVEGGEDETQYITEHANGARIVCDNSLLKMWQEFTTTVDSQVLTFKFSKSNHTQGFIRWKIEYQNQDTFKYAGDVAGSNTNGTFTEEVTMGVAGTYRIEIFRDITDGGTDYVLNEVHIEPGLVSLEDLGPELVTNGTFDTVTTGWTAGSGAGLSIASGELVVTLTSPDTFGNAYQAVTLEDGEVYKFAVNNVSRTIGQQAKVDKTNTSNEIMSESITALGNQFDVFTSDVEGTAYVQLVSSGDGAVSNFDDVSLRKMPHGQQLEDIPVAASNVVRLDVSTEAKAMHSLSFKVDALATDETIDVTVITW